MIEGFIIYNILDLEVKLLVLIAESSRSFKMVNTKKVVATLPVPKKTENKPPVTEELKGSKGKGKAVVSC